MDYVVAGFGIGAVVALIGFALWELYGHSDEPGQAWLTRASIGAMLGSLIIWAVTGVTLVSTLDDSTASKLVMATVVITILSITAGTIWYWRADQALLASMPQKAAQPASPRATASAGGAAPATVANVELSEWDSWPEREAIHSDTPENRIETATAPSFEPEVAIEPAASRLEAFTEPAEAAAAAPSNEEVIVTEDSVIAVDVDRSADVAAVDATITDLPPAESPVPQRADMPSAPESEPSFAILPANIQPPRKSDSDSIVAPGASEPDEPASKAAGDAPAEVAADPPGNSKIPSPKPESPPESARTQAVREPSAAFESSLLADIGSDSTEGDGRYRSPLLADLERNPDELEGVGLAKWRPDARLTGEDDHDSPPPPRRGRRR